MRNSLSIALALLLLIACKQHEEYFTLHRQIAYPKSEVIAGLVWEGAPSRYPGSGSDMHWWTVGIDGAVYVIDDDGKNFGGPEWYAHLLKVTGIPPNHKVETVNDFQFYDFRQHIPDTPVRRYVCGVVAVDSSLYVCLYDYDWNIETRPLHRDTIMSRIKEYNPWYDMDTAVRGQLGFIDAYSRNYGVAGLIVSKDLGKTWNNLPTENTPQFFGKNFGAPAFLTFGPGNTQTPEELGPYVYAISNDGSWATGDNVFLGRVHRDSILSREAWHFFAGTQPGEEVRWTRQEEQARPIFSDPGHIGHPTITYQPILKRYILCISSDMVPHREDANDEEFLKWNWHSEMQLYESKHPWGPWAIFHNEPKWGGDDHTAYLPQIPGTWFSEDGLSGTVLFAGDYVNRKGEYYGFMTQQFKLVLRK